MKVPFFRAAISEEEIEVVADVLRSGWLTTGPKARAFEEEFAKRIGGGVEAVAVNSATSGLHLALEAIGIGADDEVICPTLTFTATAEVVRYLGANVVLVDSDPITKNISIDAIKAAITPQTKAIIPVHFGGLACDMEAIISLANEHGLHIIEDAAHALPTTINGQLIGALDTSATVFSFYANKTMTTGEGGMLVSRNRDLIARARKMRLHGIDRDAFARFTEVGASWRYDIVAPGFKYNMTDMAAVLGISQLRQIDAFQQRRATQARRYDAALTGLPITTPAWPKTDDIHAWHIYPITLTAAAPIQRDALIQALSDDGIGTSVHYTPLHMMSYWRAQQNHDAEAFPVAFKHANSTLSLPLFVDMHSDEQAYVIERLHHHLGAHGDD